MLKITHKEIEFAVGDRVRVVQKIEELSKTRTATFEGIVLGIKGRETGASFVVRKIGEAGVGIERIFPVGSPNIERVEVVKKGLSGVRHAKLYYTRTQSHREIEKIYSRVARKNKPIKSKQSKSKYKSKTEKTTKSKNASKKKQ